MKPLLQVVCSGVSIFMFAITNTGQSLAATEAWSSGGNRGISEYGISTLEGDTFAIVNAVGAELSDEPPCWISVSSPHLEETGVTEMNVLLDGETYPFVLEGSDARDPSLDGFNLLMRLVSSLRNTDERTFAAMFPRSQIEITFSTRNARGTLEDALEGCDGSSE